ncbi:MAG TPA: DegT/DnrJ/EryC1/StrS family aminotransferase [Burkholderiales bacterium]|nr:DegT/DnrJ/EryC1/StrS family aminotransferase [Burkholderiales bacterium]
MSLSKSWGEIPPTAGLPVRLSDLLSHGSSDLATAAAGYLGVDRARVECSGTACLIVILATLRRLSPRRRVIVPAYTCPLVILAVVHVGLEPVLCDTAPNDFGFALDALAMQCGSDTLAVIPAHLAGRVADVEPVVRIAHAHGAFVVEDGAQAFGARWRHETVGLLGDAGFFSFAVGKGITLYEGGLWITRRAELFQEIERTGRELIRSNALLELLRAVQLAAYALLYRPSTLRWVYGMPLRRALRVNDFARAAGDRYRTPIPLHAVGPWRQRVGVAALRRLAAFHEATRQQADARIGRLGALPGLRVFVDRAHARGVWPCLLVKFDSALACDRVLLALWGARVGVSRMFAHALPDYDYLKFSANASGCPNAVNFAASTLTISNSPWLDAERFEVILRGLEQA